MKKYHKTECDNCGKATITLCSFLILIIPHNTVPAHATIHNISHKHPQPTHHGSLAE